MAVGVGPRRRGRPRNKPKYPERHQHRWTAAEDERLRRVWGDLKREVLRRLPGRTWLGIVRRARNLGLKTGVPEGFELILTAAKRAGYQYATMLRILRWAGVEIRRHWRQTKPVKRGLYRKPESTRRAAHWHIVEIEDTDEAVARWHKTETIFGAARARDVPKMTLTAWLREAGLLTAKNRFASTYRIQTADIDRVIRERRATRELPTIAVHARERKMNPDTLRRWLRASGVKAPTKKKAEWRVSREVVAKVVAKRPEGLRGWSRRAQSSS